MSEPSEEIYKLVYTVPASHLQETKDSIFAVGGGVYANGKYVQVAFETKGQGQFLPAAEANPHIGTPGSLEKVDEIRVEIRCTGRDVARKAVQALKR
jgi:hypothetical protein